MKRLICFTVFLLCIISISCNPHVNNNAAQAEVNTADSAGRADSISAVDKTASEREAFRIDLERRLDSMQTRMNALDSLYVTKKEKDRANWIAGRERIKARMNRLNEKKKNIPTITKEKWAEFKENIDTAMNNLKMDWNTTLDKLKAK